MFEPWRRALLALPLPGCAPALLHPVSATPRETRSRRLCPSGRFARGSAGSAASCDAEPSLTTGQTRARRAPIGVRRMKNFSRSTTPNTGLPAARISGTRAHPDRLP